MRASVIAAFALLALCASCLVLADATQLTLDSDTAGRELLQSTNKPATSSKTPAQKRPAVNAGAKPASPTKPQTAVKKTGARLLLEDLVLAELAEGRELLQTKQTASSSKPAAKRTTANTKKAAPGKQQAVRKDAGRHLLEVDEVFEGRELLQTKQTPSSSKPAGTKRPQANAGTKKASPGKQQAVKPNGRHLLEVDEVFEGRELLQTKQTPSSSKPAGSKRPAANTGSKKAAPGKQQAIKREGRRLSEFDMEVVGGRQLLSQPGTQQKKPGKTTPAASTAKPSSSKTPATRKENGRRLLNKPAKDQKGTPKPAASTGTKNTKTVTKSTSKP